MASSDGSRDGSRGGGTTKGSSWREAALDPSTTDRSSRWKRRREARQADETLRARSPLYAAAVLLFIASLVLRQPLLFVSALLIGAVAALPEIWYRHGLRALVIEYRLANTRAVFGDTVELALVVENRKLLPLPWVEVDAQFPDLLPVLGLKLEPSAIPERAILRNTMALWAFQRVRRRYRVAAIARGAYTFGPLDVHVTDPFGILTRDARRPVTSTLLVYPLIAPIERFGLAARAPFGERATPQRLLEDPLRVAGTRDYAPGDEPRRIHWKATARMGNLQSKVYEPSARHTVMIFLDLRTFKHVAYGYTPELVELAISAAASVTRWALEQRYAVGLVSNGTLATANPDEGEGEGNQRLRVPPSSRPEQLTLILDGLARMYPYYGAPVEKMVASEQGSLAAGATVVYIGNEAVLDVPAILALRQLRSRGHAVSLLLTTRDEGALPRGERDDGQNGSNGHRADRPDQHLVHLADLPIHYLGGVHEWDALAAEVLGPGRVRRASMLTNLRGAEALRASLQGIHAATTERAERRSDGSAYDPTETDRRPAEPRPFVLE